MRARYGLDRPIDAQLALWFRGLAHLDLGESIRYGGRPVAGLVFERARNTARLALVALAIALGLGLPIGVLTGARPRGWLSRIVTPISIALVACPPIVGALALLLLAVWTGWLSTSTGSLGVPALALGLPLAAAIERLQSRATAEALAAPDIAAAAARGVPASRLLWIHAGRQSLRPLLGIFGVILGSLFSGSLAVEVLTAWPGLGQLMSDSIRGRDLLVTAGCALVGAALLAIGNVVADVIRFAVDPRTGAAR
jgi:peptide/nickel transport system permease protein